MDKKITGEFSKNLFALELQVKTLLEGVGGDRLIHLLDLLCTITRSEQEVVLDAFAKVVEKVATGDTRLVRTSDEELKAFEDGLYEEILTAIQERSRFAEGKKLRVVSGGKKEDTANSPINLEKERRARRLEIKPVVN